MLLLHCAVLPAGKNCAGASSSSILVFDVMSPPGTGQDN